LDMLNNTILLVTFFIISLMSCKKRISQNTVPIAPVVDEEVYVSKYDNSIVSYYSFNQNVGSWYEKSECCTWSGVIDPSIKKSGTASLRVELQKNDISNGHRSELGAEPSTLNKEGWYAFSVLLPSSYIKDSMEESIVQWQSKPDFTIGETWRSAPLFLGVLDDRFVLEIRTDPNKLTLQGQYDFVRIDLGAIEKEKWHDWVFHIKWAYDKTGVIEVWHNKKLVLTRASLPNSYNDETYPYFKFGIYRWGWDDAVNTTVTKRVLYFDELRIGNEKCNYALIAPIIK